MIQNTEPLCYQLHVVKVEVSLLFTACSSMPPLQYKFCISIYILSIYYTKTMIVIWFCKHLTSKIYTFKNPVSICILPTYFFFFFFKMFHCHGTITHFIHFRGHILMIL